MKPNWDEYFLCVMEAVSLRASCDRGKSGCVIVKNNHILVTGYVGAPPKFSSCDEVGHKFQGRFNIDIHLKKIIDDFPNHPLSLSHDKFSVHCIRTIHAEQNAILQAAKLGIALEGATLYCRMTPCSTCAMFIISVGIKRVYCERKYQKAAESEEMFKQAGIEIVYKFDEEQKYS